VTCAVSQEAEMKMLKIKVLGAAVNCVTLEIDLERKEGARIYRSRRAAGPYEEVGVARERVYVDSAAMAPGKTYYYLAASWTTPWLIPEPKDLREGDPVRVKVPCAPKEKQVTVVRKRHRFSIDLGGYLDESNTVTKQPTTYCPGPGHRNPPHDQVFEPNLYVVIENVGNADVINPWVVANNRRDWWSVETMTREILRGVGGKRATETDKAMAIWKFVSEGLYDQRAGKGWFDSAADPVRVFNVYGFDGCTANAVVARRLSEAMGLKAREVWLGALALIDGHGRGRCCDHDIYEVWADGSWHFLDTDMMLFLLKRDNRTVAGSQDLVRDADLLRRAFGKNGLAGRDLMKKEYYYEWFRRNMIVYPKNKGCVWNDDAGNLFHTPGTYPAPRTMALRLRPGEKLVRYWGNVGKNVVHGPGVHPDARFSNGKLVYAPDLRGSLWPDGAESSRGIARETSGGLPAVHPQRTGETAEVVWKVASPYAIAGARVGLSCRRATREDGLEVMFSRDGRHWRSIWVTPAHESEERNYIAARMDACIELGWLLNSPAREQVDRTTHGNVSGPCYAYYVKVAMWAGSRPDVVGLDAIRFDTDIQCSTASLPALFRGKNALVYRDDTLGPRRVKVTYGWQENHTIRPPDAPELVYPKRDADVDSLDFEFRWKRARGRGARVDDYHVQVSRYSDFRWCVSPMFDRYVSRGKYKGKTRWQAELPNLLNPDERYYWRVRARNARGVWSEWSEVRAFVPHGPGLPVDLKIARRGRRRILTWSRNPEGNRPVAYRVHGSAEQGGFTAGKENLLAVVEDTCWPLMGARKGMSYRVVAVDANDVPSTPSEFIEL